MFLTPWKPQWFHLGEEGLLLCLVIIIFADFFLGVSSSIPMAARALSISPSSGDLFLSGYFPCRITLSTVHLHFLLLLLLLSFSIVLKPGVHLENSKLRIVGIFLRFLQIWSSIILSYFENRGLKDWETRKKDTRPFSHFNYLTLPE